MNPQTLNRSKSVLNRAKRNLKMYFNTPISGDSPGIIYRKISGVVG